MHGFGVERSRTQQSTLKAKVRFRVTAIQLGFELYECLLLYIVMSDCGQSGEYEAHAMESFTVT